jgi:hypothetical protein
MKTKTLDEIFRESGNLSFVELCVCSFQGTKYFGYTNSLNITDPEKLYEDIVYQAHWVIMWNGQIDRNVTMTAIRRGNLIYFFESISSVELVEALSEEIDDIVEVYRLAEIQTTL